jgi:Protein of unknown function (DUF3237)
VPIANLPVKQVTSAFDNLPASLTAVNTRSLFVMRLDVKPYQVLGDTPAAFRRVGVVPGGSFAGERLSGVVLEGGNDWQTIRKDGATTLDVRLVLKTTDDSLIGMTYKGIRHGPADVIARIDAGEPLDPALYYFRTSPTFETASEGYDWINRITAVGLGYRTTGAVIYSVFEIL